MSSTDSCYHGRTRQPHRGKRDEALKMISALQKTFVRAEKAVAAGRRTRETEIGPSRTAQVDACASLAIRSRPGSGAGLP